MAHPLASIWEEQQAAFLSDSNDKVTVYYKPERTGADPSFDGFFNESTDPGDPSDFENITIDTESAVDVYGKVHLDLYGLSVSAAESEQQLPIGVFENSDALFTCLLSDVKNSTDPAPIRTIFHTAYRIVPEKDGEQYSIIGIKSRGMAAAFVVDVFLKKTNKESYEV